jgi:hypothetical protein
MNKNIKTVTSLLIFGLLTGCGSSINLTKYQPSTLQKAKNMPSSDVMMDNNLPRVVIIDIDNSNIRVALQAKIGTTIANKVNSLLSNGKSVKVVKRVNKSNLISEEIKFAQLSKELDTDIGQAQYLITGELSSATYEHSFREGYFYRVKTKSGTVRRYAPPSISYSSCVVGNIKIFSLPSLEQEESFEYDECARKSTQVRSSRDVVKRDDGLVRKAAMESADTISYPLKNFFSKKGYIYEKKIDGSDMIIKTTLGSKTGAKDGADVVIYAVENSKNILTGKTSKEVVKIGEGIISNQITDKSSWIIIKDMEDGKIVHAGDYVKMKYKESIWSKGFKSLK